MMRFLRVILLCIIPVFAFAQQNVIDSLKTLLASQKDDTNKVLTHNQLAWQLFLVSDYDAAKKQAAAALELGEKLAFSREIARSLSILGSVFYGEGNFPEALSSNFRALKIREQLGNKKDIATSHNNLAVIYKEQGQFDLALKENELALKIRQELGDKAGIKASHNNIGTVYHERGNYQAALKEYTASLKICEEIQDEYGIAMAYNNIAVANYILGNYAEAYKHYEAALKIREQIDDAEGIANAFIGIGSVLMKQGQAEKGKKYFEKALALGFEIGSKSTLQYCYSAMAEADSLLGNFKSSLYNYKMFIRYRDSLINEANTVKTVQQQMQYEFDKKEAIAKADQEKKDALAEEEKQKQQLIIWTVAGGLAIVILFALFLFRSLHVTRKQKQVIEKQKNLVDEQKQLVEEQKKHIEEKQKEVLDSIRYARRIQSALITSEANVGRMLRKLNNKNH